MISEEHTDRHSHRPGLIDFLEDRWRFAESSDANARRAILLLAGTLAAGVLALLLLVAIVTLLGLLLALLAERYPPTVLALVPLVGAGGGLVISIHLRRQR